MHSPESFYSMEGSASRRGSDARTAKRTSPQRQAAVLPTLSKVHETYSCGDKYEGTVSIDAKGTKTKHGWGRYMFSNGSYYDGNWEKGSMHGKGSFLEVTTGDRFDGMWDHGKRVYGVYYFHDGDLYIGGFDDKSGHLKHGRAVVVEDMIPYDAVYRSDRLVQRALFDTTAEQPPQPHHHRNAPEVAVEQQQRRDSNSSSDDAAGWAQREHRHVTPHHVDVDEQYAAAKLILRTKREDLESTSAATHTKQFGNTQRGRFERFSYMRNADANDAFRYHHK